MKTLNTSAYYTRLSDFGLIKVNGPDAAQFLQGQVSCDINTLNEQHSSLGACCDRKGRILFSFRIFLKAEDYYLYLPNSMIERAIQHLSQYRIIAKVSFSIHKANCFGLGGMQLNNWCSTHFLKTPKRFNEMIQNETESLICVDEKTPRFLFITPNVNRCNELDEASNDDWQWLDIEQGIATIYPETQELFIPQMLDYEKWEAISFTKGCYVGQEIIARTQHLGKLKRHLHRLKSEKMLPRGAEVLNDKAEAIGTVVECSRDPKGNFVLLAVIKNS